jgi:hypothetical protein
MKRCRNIIILGIGAGLLLYVVWWFGIVLEFEYPYALTLLNAKNARSVAGVPIRRIIEASGNDWEKGRWHTCSYCAYRCGDHENLISVKFDAPSGIWFFAYCSTTRELVPMNDSTAAQFPAMMPVGDSLKSVSVLNGKLGGGGWVYNQELKLPVKWFRVVTGK